MRESLDVGPSEGLRDVPPLLARDLLDYLAGDRMRALYAHLRLQATDERDQDLGLDAALLEQGEGACAGLVRHAAPSRTGPSVRVCRSPAT